MKISHTSLSGLLIIEPNIFADDRGSFFEAYKEKLYVDHHIPPFIQDNVSHSRQNVLRGLHYQLPNSQGKLVSVLNGTVWDVALDIRTSSPTFGKWYGIILSDQNNLQMYIPPGFAHGFCVLSEKADFYYKCTAYYDPKSEHGIAWNDPGLDIKWPITNPILSPKDKAYPSLSKINHELLFP